MPSRPSRRARVQDVHDVAAALPHVVDTGTAGRPVYAVGGRSFVFFRNRRPDAFDPETGERYDDVVVFWVPDDETKQALVADPSTPYFTTPHFDGHPSVLRAFLDSLEEGHPLFVVPRDRSGRPVGG